MYRQKEEGGGRKENKERGDDAVGESRDRRDFIRNTGNIMWLARFITAAIGVPLLFWTIVRPWGTELIVSVFLIPLTIEWTYIRTRIAERLYGLFVNPASKKDIEIPYFLDNSYERAGDFAHALAIVGSVVYDSDDQHWTQFSVFVAIVSIILYYILSLKSLPRKTTERKFTENIVLWALCSCVLRIFGILYVPLCMTYLILLSRVSPGYTIMMLWSSFQCDTGGLVVGRFFGKRKVITHISPNKTLEGYFGGVIVSIGSTMLLYSIRERVSILPQDDIMAYLIVGGVAIVGTILGDLFGSLLKRSAGIKDSGGLFPGHGGALDRADALLLTAPLVFFSIK